LIVPALGGLLAAGTAAAAPPAVPAQAPAAGTVVTSIDNGGGLSVRAAAGKANAISVSLTNITFTVRDTGDVVVPGAGCTAVDANVVRCTAFGQRVSINTGDLADVVNAPLPLPTTVQAGEGDDTVTTGTAADSLQGALGSMATAAARRSPVKRGGTPCSAVAGPTRRMSSAVARTPTWPTIPAETWRSRSASTTSPTTVSPAKTTTSAATSRRSRAATETTGSRGAT
jgi:hypothetical protein